MLAKAGFAKKDAVGAMGRLMDEALGKVRNLTHGPSPAMGRKGQIARGIVWGSGGERRAPVFCLVLTCGGLANHPFDLRSSILHAAIVSGMVNDLGIRTFVRYEPRGRLRRGGLPASVRVAVGMAFVPGPGGGHNVFELGVFGLPAQFAYRPVRGGHKPGRIAGAARL